MSTSVKFVEAASEELDEASIDTNVSNTANAGLPCSSECADLDASRMTYHGKHLAQAQWLRQSFCQVISSKARLTILLAQHISQLAQPVRPSCKQTAHSSHKARVDVAQEDWRLSALADI